MTVLRRVLILAIFTPVVLWGAVQWVYDPEEIDGLTGNGCDTFVLPAVSDVTHHPDGVCRETPTDDGFVRQIGRRMHANSHSTCGGGSADVEVLRACVLGPDGQPAAGAPTPCGPPNANTTGANGCRVCGPSNPVTCHSATLAQQISYLDTLRIAAAGTPLADKLQTAIERAEDAEAYLAASQRQTAAGSMASAVAQLQGIVDKGFMFPGRGATLMDDLAGFARQLAVTAIEEAELRGGSPAAIAGARTKLAEGDGHRSGADFKDATSKYKDAIGKADGA